MADFWKRPPLMRELIFKTADLGEREASAFHLGVLEALEKLGAEVEYDDVAPDLSEYKVYIKEQIHGNRS